MTLLRADESLLVDSRRFNEQWIEQVIRARRRNSTAPSTAGANCTALHNGNATPRAMKRIAPAPARSKIARGATRTKRAVSLNLLLQVNVAREEGDFYPYRYLASEGFLPGYNFPALPVRAWVPRGQDGDFIARPRFLAIREFAPHNFFYHEGGQWESVAFTAPPGALMNVSAANACVAPVARSRRPISISAQTVAHASMAKTACSLPCSTCPTCGCGGAPALPPTRKNAVGAATGSRHSFSSRP